MSVSHAGEHRRLEHAVAVERPAVGDRAPSATASSTQSVTRSRSPCEISADTSVASSSGSPTTSDVTSSTSASVNASAIDEWTKMRWVEMQLCPAWEKPATLILAAAVSQSPSGSMITGALLPSSRPTFLRGARARMLQPTSGEPVNVIRAMSSWSTRALPTVAAAARDDVEPLGRQPALVDQQLGQRDGAERRLADAGLSTTGHPAAIAGASLWATRLSGKLNGRDRTDHADRHAQREAELADSPPAMASSGTMSPASVRASAAANRNVPAARSASTRAVLIGLAASLAMMRGELVTPLGEQARRGRRGSRPASTAAAARRQRALAQRRRRDRRRRLHRTAPGRSLPRRRGRSTVDGVGGGEALAGERQCSDIGHG